MSAFQIVSLIIFIVLGIIGILMFAGIVPTPGGGGSTGGGPSSLLVWGTLPNREVGVAMRTIGKPNEISVKYEEKDVERFEIDLLRAITNGDAPDLVLFPHDILLKIEDSLFVFNEDVFSERTYKDTYFEGGEIFINEQGISSLPILVDPYVLYWNRDIFNNERITEVPRTWSDVLNLSSKVTIKDSRGKVLRSTIGLGESNNISHFKDIYALLALQAGDGIVVRDLSGAPSVLFGKNLPGESGPTPAVSALNFYTGFSDPVKRHYTWNSSLPLTFDSFAQGDTALYVGPASEFEKIKNKNPLLNYDVARIPQLAGNRELDFGRIYAIGIIASSNKSIEKLANALYLFALTDNKNQQIFADMTSLPPAKRILLGGGGDSPSQDIFYDAAIISRAWLDPDPDTTENLFSKMISDVSTRVRSSEGSVESATAALKKLFR